ncbi:HlyD family efflux transporter periplasmic adaptor subunit [Lactobacillus sp. LL6]|uniref:HlyD family efflux transporter periplasmic adaptor subunit n=1 Tax=Lactobacillus sp. LL6 TaxID=2596827 RepID=UPI001186BFD2|nr:HlyD family efflux transporter periplasmic adaptor subunit [Lactobacillus sp. LL6]TSO26989.1 HlyD family efflux transporter periplasmic adaptor subunit [Lactobacillus sp. LL6]
MNDDFESSKFYSYKSKALSRIVILPAFILILLVFISSIFMVKEDSIHIGGIIVPKNTMIIKNNKNYVEGKYVYQNQKVQLVNGTSKKLAQDKVVHVDKANNVILVPNIKEESSLEVVSYVGVDEVKKLDKNQKVKFEIKNKKNVATLINGKINSIGVYPDQIKGKEAYKVSCLIYPSKRERNELRYGMQGSVAIIVNRESYFNFIKDTFLGKEN